MRYIILLLSLAAPVYAGSITGINGSLDFPDPASGDGTVQITGSRGFSFIGVTEEANVEATDCAFGCLPGERISIGLNAGGLPGVATLNGVDYTDVGGPETYDQFDLTVAGFGHAPTLKPGFVTVTRVVRGVFQATFYHVAPIPLTPVTDTIFTHCAATITWVPVQQTWEVHTIDYDLLRR